MMYRSWLYMMEDRLIHGRDPAERTAERDRRAWARQRPSLRARMARRLFALAVAAEREETWRLVWERLEARGRL